MIENSQVSSAESDKEEEARNDAERALISPKVHEQTDSGSPDAVSAAEYDPSKDRIADDDRQRAYQNEETAEKDRLLKSKDEQERVTDGIDSHADMAASDYTEKLENHQKQPNQPKVIDMFAEDLDIFATAEIADPNALLVPNTVPMADSNPGLLDNWDDAEGYYSK